MAKKREGQSEFVKWMGPLLDCLRSFGGSAKPREASAWIASKLQIPQSKIEETLKSGEERFHNQVAWARQYLAWEGLLDPSRRGVWTLTPKGWKTTLTEEDGRKLFLKWVEIHQISRKSASRTEAVVVDAVETIQIPPSDLQEEFNDAELLGILKNLHPRGFELVCRRLLHESGFEDVVVTGQSNDGGIDGYGYLLINAFIRIKVVFQCKRYKETVARKEVGDFRNAMLGRAEKGIFITTGTFSSSAQKEANRDGVPPIELVDGERLVTMFEKAKLGVFEKIVYEPDQAFFDQFRQL
jgi:restriction system protein